MTSHAVVDFAPDCDLVANLHPSPNVNERRNVAAPSILILHYTGLACAEQSISVLSDPRCQVSCHYVVDECGLITQMVAERMRAWHAGLSYWQGHTDLNSMSIGIEIQNPGHDGGYPDFSDQQMQSVVALSKDITARHGMRPEHVLAHSDVAPLRKLDPGEKFDWKALWQAGIGHWVEPVAVPGADAVAPDPDRSRICKVQGLLAKYGYDCPVTGTLDRKTTKVVMAFQRHFRPARVDGLIDHSTHDTLRRLVGALKA